jgi:cytoskeletal protein RodZ
LLRETREKKGLTFDEVSNVLFIKTRAIGAIEVGDWDNLPAPVYVKGYVTQYAAFLNILDLLEGELSSKEDKWPVRGTEGVSQRKERILAGWKFRSRRRAPDFLESAKN